MTSPLNAAPRRNRSQVRELRRALYEIVFLHRPMTVRQIFYQATVLGLVEKTEAAYRGTVCRLLGLMREEEELPFEWIADNTRWMRKPNSYSGLEQLLADSAELYRRDIWRSQRDYVEIWCEKEALAGVLFYVTREWDVPLMVTRGYASKSYLHGAATTIEAIRKPSYVYYFGDYDPSGLDIARAVNEGLRKYAATSEIHFERVAVTLEQIERWSLPSRPTKKTDSRAKSFEGRSVELDAIPPDDLRQLARDCIERHIDSYALEQTRRIESLERDTLGLIANKAAMGEFDGGGLE
ncbi:MAG: hypothetical protein AB7U73_05110 [Pirellulales bacterium]